MNLLQYGCQCQIMTETSFGQRECLSEKILLRGKFARFSNGSFNTVFINEWSKDRLDEACVKWHQCRKCISMDEDLTIGQGKLKNMHIIPGFSIFKAVHKSWAFEGQKKRNCSPKNDLYQIGVNVDTGELSCQLSSKSCPQWIAMYRMHHSKIQFSSATTKIQNNDKNFNF